MTNLVEHFERFLGPITSGWSADPDGHSAPVYQPDEFSI
jgi:hypothetical protein